jgi:hypothetical protein
MLEIDRKITPQPPLTPHPLLTPHAGGRSKNNSAWGAIRGNTVFYLFFLQYKKYLSDALEPLLPRLYNSLDLLLLNPPYVLTKEDPENNKV